jgi:hypothetical protein
MIEWVLYAWHGMGGWVIAWMVICVGDSRDGVARGGLLLALTA